MNEPIFTLETTPDGTRRLFADPWTAPVAGTPNPRPPARPLRARLLAGVFGIASVATRRLFPVRS